MPAQQIPNSMPIDANGREIEVVVPEDWGQFQMFRKTVTAEASLLLSGLKNAADEAVAIPAAQTMELTGILIQNFQSSSVWWGDEDVSAVFGHPIRAADPAVDSSLVGSDQPGFALLTGVDPNTVYLAGSPEVSGVDVLITLFGKFEPATTEATS